MFIAHWVLAQILGFVSAVLFESPFLAMQKVIYHYYTKKHIPQPIVFSEQP